MSCYCSVVVIIIVTFVFVIVVVFIVVVVVQVVVVVLIPEIYLLKFGQNQVINSCQIADIEFAVMVGGRVQSHYYVKPNL